MPEGLRLSADRERAILENTGEPFYFEHEEITDVDNFPGHLMTIDLAARRSFPRGVIHTVSTVSMRLP